MRFDTLLRDLRYTFRTLRRNAAFTLFVVLIAGLGIGASSTVFSVVNTIRGVSVARRFTSRQARSRALNSVRTASCTGVG